MDNAVAELKQGPTQASCTTCLSPAEGGGPMSSSMLVVDVVSRIGQHDHLLCIQHLRASIPPVQWHARRGDAFAQAGDDTEKKEQEKRARRARRASQVCRPAGSGQLARSAALFPSIGGSHWDAAASSSSQQEQVAVEGLVRLTSTRAARCDAVQQQLEIRMAPKSPVRVRMCSACIELFRSGPIWAVQLYCTYKLHFHRGSRRPSCA